MIGDALTPQTRPILEQLGQTFVLLSLLAAIMVLPTEGIWWTTATDRYLRMRHPWRVGVAVVVMATLAAILIMLGISISRFG